jgi:hypothetical protein
MLAVDFVASDKSRTFRIEIHDYEIKKECAYATDFLLTDASFRNIMSSEQSPNYHNRGGSTMIIETHSLPEQVKNFQNGTTDNVYMEPMEPKFEINMARIPNDNSHIKIFGRFDKPSQSKDHAYGDILYPFEFIMSKKSLPKIISQLEAIAERYPYKDE